MPPELPADYYLSNFSALLDFVHSRYGDLLNAQEIDFYATFFALPTGARKLYIRMLTRRPDTFRLSRLVYTEIPDIPRAAQQLAEAGLARVNEESDPAGLLNLFTVPELKKLFGEVEVKGKQRADRQQAILAGVDADAIKQCVERCDTIISILQQDVYEVYSLCFFGNQYQSLTDFILRDLGLLRYADYRIDSETRLFQSREQLDAHIAFYLCLAEFVQRDDTEAQHLSESDAWQDPAAIVALADALPAPQDALLARRIDRTRNQIARQLERLGCLDEALVMFQQCRLPPSRERQSRICHARDAHEQALALCKQIVEQPLNEEERLFAESFGARVAKRWYRDVTKSGSDEAPPGVQQAVADWPAPRRYNPPVVDVVLTDGDERVEQLALDYLSASGHCFYVENTLFPGVFALVFWDIIYHPLPGVFVNPFQAAPLDFYQSEFIAARRSLIEARFEELTSLTWLKTRVFDSLELHKGTVNPLVHWDYLQEPLLELALTHIPLLHWKNIFHRLLGDLRNNTHGLPDLVVFEPSGYRLVEVKGPGDTLQANQRRWMAWFAQHEIPHSVLQVTFQAASKVTDMPA